MTSHDNWWKEFFPLFTPVFKRISARETNDQIRFIVGTLGIRSGSKVLDCPTGIGRIAIPLAKRGVRVTGIDFLQEYLDRVAKRASRAGLKIALERSDMRRITHDRKFDAVINMWTSFGYFEQESDNQRVLARFFKALKPGGRCLIHTINRDWIMVNFQPKGFERFDNTIYLEDREFDYARSTSTTAYRVIRDGEEHQVTSTLRLYSPHELIAMMKQAGFVDVVGYGGAKREPVSRDQRMLYVTGRRPK
jgi:ubiquinone/menaquinone biosynthesis C-methylase UbiE